MTLVVDLSVSSLFLLKDQSFPGRCVVALKNHRKEIFEMTAAEREGFLHDLTIAAETLQEVFSPDKLNYAVFGDEVPHFHVHLVPKYRGKTQWGKAYCSEAVAPVLLTEEDFRKRLETIRRQIEKSQKDKI